jgi:nicotinate-nucleotide adenylyltransferase
VRLAMVRDAAAADPRFVVATLELEREGPSYTVDTVRTIRGEHPDADIYLVVGADQLAAFDTWRDPEEIVKHVRLAVMDREGASAVQLSGALPPAWDVIAVPVRRVDVSSTEVRRRVREGRDIGDLVPAGVRTIIERERLYSAA